MSACPSITVMVKPVSGMCNMCCRYCFYADELSRRSEPLSPMSIETLEKLVRRVMNAADRSVHFLFQGGEPTLAGLGFYQALIGYQKKYLHPGQTVTNAIQSNGLNIPDGMIAFFAEHGFLVGISLDGAASTHDRFRIDAAGNGTWARIAQTLKKLDAARVEYNILCVVNEEVAAQPAEVMAALRGFRFLQFIPCLDPLDGIQDEFSLQPETYLSFLKYTFDEYAAAFRTSSPFSIRMFDNWIGLLRGFPAENCAMIGRCGASVMIESNGDIYPCDFYGLDEWKLGNICTDSLLGVLNSEKESRFIRESLPVPARCQTCRWYPLCRNGCKRERAPETGFFRWCGVYQAFFEYAQGEMQRIAESLR